MFVDSKMNQPDFFEFMDDVSERMVSQDEIELRKLIDEIAQFDIYDFIARISSLNLLIENQNKSILLDALIAGILSRAKDNYRGTAKMSNGRFRKIVTKLDNFSLRMMIDPAENAFIERVRYYGNYWIFPGINYSPSYCLQGFLDAVCLRNLKLDAEFTNKAHQLINFVLQLSTRIVHTLEYDLNSIRHIECSSLKIADATLADKMENCVRFDYSIIETMIVDEDLQRCLFTDFFDENLSQVINGEKQRFFTHPFLKVDDETVILLNPSILVSFLIHQLIILSDVYGSKGQLIDAYNNEIWKKCRKDIRNLGHKKIQEDIYGISLINNRYRKEEILTVGNNKLLFVQFVCDGGDDYGEASMFEKAEIDIETPTTRERAEYFVENLPQAQWDNVYQIVIINSFGRTVGSRVTKDELRYAIQLSPFELHCISVNERDRNEFLPRYIDAKKKIKTPLPPMLTCELNNIEIYTSNDYSFYLSDDLDPTSTFVYFGFGDSLDYVIRAVKREDRHLIGSYDGEHLCEIILNDPARNIYFNEKGIGQLPESVVKFEKVNIWFTTDEVDSVEKLDIYYSIIDAMSYWLAEAKNIINDMVFTSDCICIHLSLLPPVEQFYSLPTEKAEFKDCVHYNHLGNVINMDWQPLAYQLFGDEQYNAEKAMIESVFEELEKFSEKAADSALLDQLFSNPLKKKIYSINIVNAPYLMPTHESMPIVSAEEEHQLLDEIGAHFLSLPNYNYGRVPDEQRAELANQVVGYLYSLLQTEVASVIPVGVYERVCLDLETVLYQAMLSQKRYAYEISCYPEKAVRILKQNNEINKSSVALKFLAEYIASTPPSGEKVLASMQYDRIIAICSLVIEWAYKNDLFRYNIFNTPVEFLQSGRIGMRRSEGDYLSHINTAARSRQLESLSDPNVPRYSPHSLMGEFYEKIDDAFSDEYNFTFKQFLEVVMSVADYGEDLRDDVKRAPRTAVIEAVLKKTEINVDIVERILNQIILSKRDDFLIPPQPYAKHDVYPWRFNRELSFTRRPIIQYNEDLIWGNRQLHHMWRYMIDLIMEGKYKARKPKLKKLIGELSNKRGNNFNTAVYQKLSTIDGLIVREKLSKINGKKIADKNKNVLGDIDVFYIVPEKKKIVVGEVKDFSFAKNPYEMDQEYQRIFVDGDKPCYMTKHKRRADWIKNHMEDVKQHFNLPDGKWSVKTVMFVSEEIVSNAFYHKGEKIIVYSEISEKNVKAV